jgi:polysaccharide export outer membrane protein
MFLVPALFFVITALSFAQTASPQSVAGGKQSLPSEDIMMAAGDLIDVTVFDTPELSREVRISGNGTVSLPLLGDVPVAGKNEAQAARDINEAYLRGGYVRRPQTSVIIREFASKGVSVLGEVAHPGVYPVPGPRSVVDVIALAGGFTPLAETTVTVRRAHDKTETTISLPVDDAAKSLDADAEIFPGDRIIVQRASLVYVLGDVGRPGGYLMQHNGTITVLQAVAQASGTGRVSGEDRAVLLRRKGSGYTTTPIALRKMYKGKIPDMVMQPEDVLYVPSSNLRNFIVSAPSIAGSLAGAAIYSIRY